MSPAQAAVACRRAIRPKNLHLRSRARWFLLATIFFLAPPHVNAAVSVTISPSSVNLTQNGTQQFTATVTGSSDTTVIWTIQEGPSGGTVTGTGLYSAPATVGVYHVVATSNADNTQSATATVGVPGFVQSGMLLYPHPCTATLLPNGTILYTGGGSGSGAAFANAEIYDPVTSRSTPTGNMVVPRCAEPATLLPNGKVLFAGGQSFSETAAAELYDPVSGTFTATGSMSVARVGHTATLLQNEMVLIAGGTGGNCGGSACFLNTAELYNPSSGTFSPAAGNMVIAASTSVATLLSSGKVLIAGGFTSTTDATGTAVAELYDPASGLFTQTGSMVNPRADIFTATLLQNGKVLFAGGFGNVGGTTVGLPAEIYDPSAGTFATTGSLNISRDRHTATLLSNGKVLIAGGNPAVTAAAAELYDPATGVFSLTGTLQEPRILPAATLLANGTVIIAAGGYGASLVSIETYDPSLGVFNSPGTFMKVERTGQTTTKLADGRFLIIGGLDASRTILSSAEIYDPSTNKFTLTGSLAAAREMHTATLLGNGMVLVVGGYSDLNLLTVVPTAELYNPVTGTFGPASSPNVARAEHTATLLQNGKVLIAGGQLEIPPPPVRAATSAELYDPIAGTFTLAGNMNAPRSNHTATLLNDGRVLIAEGVFDVNESSTGAKYPPYELYDPSAGTFTPFGDLINADGAFPGPFDSIVLANGQVFVDPGTIFDPVTNTTSGLPPETTEGGAYKFILLPSSQVFAVGGEFSSPADIYDPVSNQFAPVGNTEYVRLSPGAALLPNGEVLVAAGAPVRQVEFWVAPVPAPAPVITNVSPNPITGFAPVPITIQGANFTSGSVIWLNGTIIPTTIVSVTELTATVPAITMTVPGAQTILVKNGSGFASTPFTLTVNNPRLLVSQPNGSGLFYGSVPAGGSSSQSVNFQNIGNAPLTIDSLSISGMNSADFKFDLANTNCPLQGGSLIAQQLCTATVLFAPVSQGPLAAALILAYEGPPGSPFVVPLSGTGTGQLSSTIAPTSLTFANQAVGTSSQAQSVTIMNTGDVNLNLNSVVLTDTADFSIAYSCGSMINPTKVCAIAVTFSPSTLGSISGSLVVTTNEPTPYTIPLSGMGDNFSLSAASGSSTSATVPAGQPATYKLNLTPQALSGSVTLTCVPVNPIPNATCSVTPNPAMVSGTAATVVTVSVTTMAHGGMSIPSHTQRYFGPSAYKLPVPRWLIYLLLSLALAGASVKFRRIPLALASGLLLIMLIAGCAGGNGVGNSGTPPGGGGSTGTPAGTYQLLVTAMSSGATRTITLTLTVQ